MTRLGSIVMLIVIIMTGCGNQSPFPVYPKSFDRGDSTIGSYTSILAFTVDPPTDVLAWYAQQFAHLTLVFQVHSERDGMLVYRNGTTILIVRSYRFDGPHTIIDIVQKPYAEYCQQLMIREPASPIPCP